MALAPRPPNLVSVGPLGILLSASIPGSNDVVRVVTYRPELGLFVYRRESERRWNEVFDRRSQAAGCRGCVGRRWI